MLTVLIIIEELFLDGSQDNVVSYLPEPFEGEKEGFVKGDEELPLVKGDITLDYHYWMEKR